VDGTGNIAWNNSTSYKAATPDTKPPSSITNLQSTNGTTWIKWTWIKWTWIKPKDTYFNLTQIYLNDIFQTNTAVEYFNSTGLEPETIYTIGTRTVDNSENINQTWVNASAKTASLPDTTSPLIKSLILFPTSTLTGSSINITVNVTDNVGVSGVKANGIALLNQGGNIWKGNFTALEGTHTVNVSAVDGAGNVAWNNSTSYTSLTPDTTAPSSITNSNPPAVLPGLNGPGSNPRILILNLPRSTLMASSRPIPQPNTSILQVSSLKQVIRLVRERQIILET
jgi:hypothetical protein